MLHFLSRLMSFDVNETPLFIAVHTRVSFVRVPFFRDALLKFKK